VSFENYTSFSNHHGFRFAENSNEFVNWIIFFQFFTSAVSLGLTLFQLTVVSCDLFSTDLLQVFLQKTPFTGEFYSAVSYGSTVMVETFIYCWFGNEVIIKVNTNSLACIFFMYFTEQQCCLCHFRIRLDRSASGCTEMFAFLCFQVSETFQDICFEFILSFA
jgi:hypothetical protein